MEARAIGSVNQVFLSLLELVIITCLQGGPAKAKGYAFDLLALAQETGSSIVHLIMLFAFGLVESFSGQPGRGVRLLAAVEALSP